MPQTQKMFCRGVHNDNGRRYAWLVDEKGREYEVPAKEPPVSEFETGETYDVAETLVKGRSNG
jgi:hypothetical protein